MNALALPVGIARRSPTFAVGASVVLLLLLAALFADLIAPFNPTPVVSWSMRTSRGVIVRRDSRKADWAGERAPTMRSSSSRSLRGSTPEASAARHRMLSRMLQSTATIANAERINIRAR